MSDLARPGSRSTSRCPPTCRRAAGLTWGYTLPCGEARSWASNGSSRSPGLGRQQRARAMPSGTSAGRPRAR
eukprot:4199852-Lingulodinium_polyedra.AAC.1